MDQPQDEEMEFWLPIPLSEEEQAQFDFLTDEMMNALDDMNEEPFPEEDFWVWMKTIALPSVIDNLQLVFES